MCIRDRDKYAYTIANIVEQIWLTRYPWPQVITFDRGTEFMAEFAEMVSNDYGIERRPITTRNPQANAVIERIHQTLGNIIRVYDYENLDEKDLWTGLLSAAMFALRATYHTTLQATPMQLVFGRDAILNNNNLNDYRIDVQPPWRDRLLLDYSILCRWVRTCGAHLIHGAQPTWNAKIYSGMMGRFKNALRQFCCRRSARASLFVSVAALAARASSSH